MMADPRRPGYHFTVPAGWINDPLGVTWLPGGDGGRYELFYQFNPEAPVWAPACRWGQATSPDLVRWTDPRTALEPGPGETGCWSGSVVVDGGRPVIVYTSVLADEMGRGRVALAQGDAAWRRWTPDPAGPVLPAPPAEQGLAHVRDPFVWRAGEEWRMVLGAGGTDGRPSVLQYSSPDLRHWRPDGVLVTATDDDRGAGGTVWECPQLFPLDGAWVLIVSVWDEQPRGVACAVGDYDGRRFTPRTWQRLAGDPLYATTAFTDAAGRRCAISWLQEPGPADGPWAGALSVPWLLTRAGNRIAVAPHPDVDTLRTGVLVRTGPAALSRHPREVADLPSLADVELAADPAGGRLVLALTEDGRPLGTVVADAGADRLRLSAPGRAEASAPLGASTGGDRTVRLRLLLDGDVLEVFAPGGAVAARLDPAGGAVRLRVSADVPTARLHRLDGHGMERVVG